MILMDCERMRKPFRGKYTYCHDLAIALARESLRRTEPLGLYYPSRAGEFLPEIPKTPWHRYQKWFFRVGRDVKLFHRTTPLSRYYPTNVPLVTTVHDLNFLRDGSSPSKRREEDRRTRDSIRRAERIITISEDARRDILDWYGDPLKPIDVIYNGVTPYTGPISRPASVPEREFLFCVCRLTRSKNLQTLPPLLKGNDLFLVLAGSDMHDGHVEEILDAAAKWGVKDRVILTGPVPESEKHWYLSHCLAFVFPSLAEGFGLPVIEAMQYGKPIFSSDRTSLPEVGGDCVFYFNHDFDPDQMRQEFELGMAGFAAGRIPVEKMNAHRAKFTWEQAARQYYDLYEQCL